MASQATAYDLADSRSLGAATEGVRHLTGRDFAELSADSLELLVRVDFDLPTYIREQQFVSDPELRDRLNLKWFFPEPLACRLATVTALVTRSGAGRVLDLGCGVGHLLSILDLELDCETLVGIDPNPDSLAVAKALLADSHNADVRLFNAHLEDSLSVLTDLRLEAVVMMEIVEHMPDDEASALVQLVFRSIRPKLIVLTTPNRDFNPKMKALAANGLRRTDHVREFSRHEFATWTSALAADSEYELTLVAPLGHTDVLAGPVTQIAVWQRGTP